MKNLAKSKRDCSHNHRARRVNAKTVSIKPDKSRKNKARRKRSGNKPTKGSGTTKGSSQLKAKKATPHQSIWVPKKTIQAQRGSTQVWIPKKVLKEHYGTRPQTQAPKRQQKSQRKTKKATQRVAQLKKANKEGQQKTRKIWVKKTLLRAQGTNTYKWVPKQLLNQTTIPAK